MSNIVKQTEVNINKQNLQSFRNKALYQIVQDH